MKIAKQKLLDIYYSMNKIRDFEYKALEFYSKGYMGGSVHLYIGEEAIAATIGYVLREDDYISSTHRGHGHILGKGADPKYALAEFLGRSTGYCKGKGGSMHIADFSKGILGANGVVGGGIPGAMGAGIGIQMQNQDKISVSFFGDGAANNGTFHESINLAAVWHLPVIFVCENNSFGMTVPISESTLEPDIYKRAAGYGIPGVCIDGNNVCEIYEAMEKAIARARAGHGPTLLECKTYRWRGHYEGDPLRYRDEEEKQIWENWKDRCPIQSLAKLLMEKYDVPQSELEKLAESAQIEIDNAAEYALASSEPDVSDLMTDIFS